MTEAVFVFTKLGRKSEYSVAVRHPDGRQAVVGVVRRFFVRHLGLEGWEATGSDGHRAVHEHRWQAAGALVADLAGYPFPTIRRTPA